MPWYRRTLFVITGDHTSLSDQLEYQTDMGRFRVPIAFHHPAGHLPGGRQRKIASHIDIQPTVLDLLGLEQDEPWLFGGPLFNTGWHGRAVNQEYNNWWFENNDVQISWREGANPSSKDASHRTNAAQRDQALQTLKALQQYFINGMIDDTWKLKEESRGAIP